MLRYHLAGSDQSPEDVAAGSCRGKWIHDEDSQLYRTLGGYPPGILDNTLTNFFRRTFSLNPDNRARMCEWTNGLIKGLGSLFPCPRCGKPLIADCSKGSCPYCCKSFPTLCVIMPDGKRIVVDSPEVVVGRDDVGGSKSISRRHLYFRKLGTDIYVQNEGKGDTFRLSGNAREPLSQHALVPVEHGQVLRVGDAELRLEWCELDGRPFKKT